VQRFIRRLPFSKHRIESARIQQLSAALLAHFKPVVAQLALIDRFAQTSRPLQRLKHHPIQAEPFFM